MNRAQSSGEPRGDGARRSASHRRQGDNPTLKPVADEQQAFFDVPRARNHIDRRDGSLVRDPETSRRAAESIPPPSVSRLQRAILNVLSLTRRPLSDEEIVDRLQWIHAADSGIRSRRAELLRKGLIEVADEDGVTQHARACRRYRLRGSV